MNNHPRLLAFILVIVLMTACAPAPTSAPTAAPTATNTPAPTATALPIEPEPLIPPYLRLGMGYSPIAVHPPDMSSVPVYSVTNGSVVDEFGASAYYAVFRADPECGPQTFTGTNDFIAAMNDYAKANPEIKLIQAEGKITVHSMLVNRYGHVFLVFDDAENAANGIGYGIGALSFADTGYWKNGASGVWVNTGLKERESLSLMAGEDGHGYIVKLYQGRVIAYLNTYGATRDNIYEQWIRVMDGIPELVWDGGKMVSRGLVNNPEILNHLKGFEKYEVSEVNGVRAITVTHNGENYLLYKDEGGIWVKSYDDMPKCVRGDGTFDFETAGKIFTFGVEETKDDQGRQVITINKEDYRRYKEVVAKIYSSLDPAGLAFLDVVSSDGGSYASLTGEEGLKLNIYKDGWPQIIGWARRGDIWIATFATDKGPISVSFVEGKILYFGETDRTGDAVLEMSEVANNNKNTNGGVYLRILMTSEGVQANPDYTIKNPKSEAIVRALARGLKMSFEDFERITRPSFEWGRSQQFMVAEKLVGLEQPLPAYDIEVELLN